MPSSPRKDTFDPHSVGIYHCYNKVAQGLFLLGRDFSSGNSCSHRKSWLRDEMRRLARFMAIDVLDYAFLDNHYHVILRNRPDIVDSWDDREIVRRWYSLCPEERDESGNPIEPEEWQITLWVKDHDKVKELRQQLSDISWFMRISQQRIALRINREHEITGSHFWAGRFKAKRIVDEVGLLVCSMYVNMNLIRAGMASTAEDSRFTSLHDRIVARWEQSRAELYHAEHQGAEHHGAELGMVSSTNEAENLLVTGTQANHSDVEYDSSRQDAWLAELFLDEGAESYEQVSTMQIGIECGRKRLTPQSNPISAGRVSNKGYLPLKLDEYLKLLNWTISQRTSNRLTPSSSQTEAILFHVGIQEAGWMTAIDQASHLFGRLVGKPDRVRQTATKMGHCWAHGVRKAAAVFD